MTAWDSLAAFNGDLALVGGLATRYLTKPPAVGAYRPVTIDVDFAVQIGVSGGQYSSIRDILSAHGFQWHGQRFHKDVESMDLYIDLLTDDDENARGSVIVDDGLVVSVIPGISRALECSRMIRIRGQNMIGVEV